MHDSYALLPSSNLGLTHQAQASSNTLTRWQMFFKNIPKADRFWCLGTGQLFASHQHAVPISLNSHDI